MIDNVVSSSRPGISDFGRYKVGCLQRGFLVPLKIQMATSSVKGKFVLPKDFPIA